MKLAIAWCLLAALLSNGCRKKSPPGDPAAPVSGSPSTANSAPAARKGEFTPAPALPADSPAAKAHSEIDQKLASGNPQLQLQVLDELVQAWVMSKGSLPKDLDELVKAKMLNSLPAAPAGKRFLIDAKRGHVVLSN